MKPFITFIILLFVQNSFGANYGKFKIVENSDYNSGVEVTFLMNSSGDITILENEYYATLESTTFFEEVTLSYKGMGDEDAVEALFKLKDNKIFYGCASFVDYKNETTGGANVEILRWNKFKKKYENILTEEALTTENDCRNELLKPYQDFN